MAMSAIEYVSATYSGPASRLPGTAWGGPPLVERAVEPVRFFQIALLGVRRLALVVFHEVMDLAEHRPRAAHLPHQPFDGTVPRLAGFRQQPAGLVAEIDQDRAG